MVLFIVSLSFQIQAATVNKTTDPVKIEEPAQKLQRLPNPDEDLQNENILANAVEKSGWFTDVQVKVEKGIVVLKGNIKQKSQLDWLIRTADRLPTVLAVVDKTTLEESKVADFSPLQKELYSWLDHFKKALPRLVIGIFAILLFYFIGGFLSKISHRLWAYRIENPFLLSTVAKFSMLPFYLLMFYMLLLTMGLQNLAMTIIGGTGVLGLVLGLAFKGIAENFLSGILLALRSPFTKGDLIIVENIRGVVQNLNMRGTTVMDNDGTLILIPNTMVIQSIIQNISANYQTRTSFTISMDSENSISEAQKILLDVLGKVERILKDPPPLVLLDDLDSSNVKLKVYFWFDVRSASLIGSRSRVIAACKDALQSAGMQYQGCLRVSMITPVEKNHNSVEDKNIIEQTHNQMMKGSMPEESLKKMAQEASLPGNSQSPDLLKQKKEI